MTKANGRPPIFAWDDGWLKKVHTSRTAQEIADILSLPLQKVKSRIQYLKVQGIITTDKRRMRVAAKKIIRKPKPQEYKPKEHKRAIDPLKESLIAWPSWDSYRAQELLNKPMRDWR